MELEQADLEYFKKFVLLDEARRPPTGKRQTQAMKGFWMSRPREQHMRGSDVPVRRNVCIKALRTINGVSVTWAAADVAMELGTSTAKDVDSIRTSYYDQGVDEAAWNVFWGSFLSWREWVLESSEGRLEFFLNQYEKERGKARRESLEKLFEDLRRDEVQAARNRSWALERCQDAQARIESNRWDPNSDWQSLATDHWTVGRICAAVGQRTEATNHLSRALEIWKTHGHELPHIQVRAVSELEAAIARLQFLSNAPI
jgi:hypothetical protein